MATWKRLLKFLDEMRKLDNATHYSPAPMFWKDEDLTGRYHKKSQLRKKKSED
jgi:hypothetical protein